MLMNLTLRGLYGIKHWPSCSKLIVCERGHSSTHTADTLWQVSNERSVKRTAETELIVTSEGAAPFQRDMNRAWAAHTKAGSLYLRDTISRTGYLGLDRDGVLKCVDNRWFKLDSGFEIYLKGCRKPQKGRDPDNIKRSMWRWAGTERVQWEGGLEDDSVTWMTGGCWHNSGLSSAAAGSVWVTQEYLAKCAGVIRWQTRQGWLEGEVGLALKLLAEWVGRQQC